MALLPQKANTADNNQSMDDRSPVPAGDYLAHIVKSEFKPTKAKNGHYLNLTWKILEGPQKGKTLFGLLNLDNPNPVAVEIAVKELNSICQAMNKVGVEDSEELHNVPVTVTVAVDDSNPNYPPSNKITAYKGGNSSSSTDLSSVASPVEESAPAQQNTAATAPSENKLPWE